MRLLEEVRSGTGGAADPLMSVLYADLRRIVRGVMAVEGRHCALAPDAVVNEAFVGLVQSRGLRSRTSQSVVSPDCEIRAHFLALAARQLRLVLDECGNYKKAKGGGSFIIALHDGTSGGTNIFCEYFKLDHTLKGALAAKPSVARLLEMDCFGGMTDEEIALIEQIPACQAMRDRELARSWLTHTLLEQAQPRAWQRADRES